MYSSLIQCTCTLLSATAINVAPSSAVYPAAYLLAPSSVKRAVVSFSTTDHFSVAMILWPVYDKSTIVDLKLDGKQEERGLTRALSSKQLWSNHSSLKQSSSKLSLSKQSSSSQSLYTNPPAEHWLSNGFDGQQDWLRAIYRVSQTVILALRNTEYPVVFLFVFDFVLVLSIPWPCHGKPNRLTTRKRLPTPFDSSCAKSRV